MIHVTYNMLESSAAVIPSLIPVAKLRLQLHSHSNHVVLEVRLTITTLDVCLTSTRYEFYETDEKLTISIFDRGADPAQVSVKFELRQAGRFSHSTRSSTQRINRLAMRMARRLYLSNR